MIKRPFLTNKDKLIIKVSAFMLLIAIFATGVSGTVHDFSIFLGRV